MLLRPLGQAVLVAAVAYATYLGTVRLRARRLAPPPTAEAFAAPESAPGQALLARRLEAGRRRDGEHPTRATPASLAPGAHRDLGSDPPRLRPVELSDLDRLTLEGEPWERLQNALTLAVSARLDDRCGADHRGDTLVDIHFRGRTTARGLVVTDPRLSVREGPPLSPATVRCLEEVLARPLEVPPPDAGVMPPFEGEARTSLVLGR